MGVAEKPTEMKKEIRDGIPGPALHSLAEQ